MSSEAPDRRAVLAAVGVGLVAAGVTAGTATGAAAATSAEPATAPVTAADALRRLRVGNARFAADRCVHPDASAARRRELAAAGQKPFAIVLACADSRVPPELLFDQGLGDLFVVRSAGEVLDRAVVGSIQYAVAELKPPLLVVLGHSGCGAVKATIEAVEKHSPATGTDLDHLVTSITPAVEQAAATGATGTALVAAAVSAQVDRVVAQLRSAKVCHEAVGGHALTVTGAVYDLASGVARFH